MFAQNGKCLQSYLLKLQCYNLCSEEVCVVEEPAQNLHWSASSGRLPRHEIVRQRRGECTRPRPAPWTAAWWRAGLPWAGSCWGPQSAEEEAEHLEVWSVAGARVAEGAVGASCWSLGSTRDGRASWGSRGVWGAWPAWTGRGWAVLEVGTVAACTERPGWGRGRTAAKEGALQMLLQLLQMLGLLLQLTAGG